MRRRLTITMTAMVAGALLMAGLVTLLLTVRTTRSQTRGNLVTQADALAQVLKSEATSANRSDPGLSLRNILRLLKSPLSLGGEAVVAIGPNDRPFGIDHPRLTASLPSGLTAEDLKPPTLASGGTVSGTKGTIVFAAAPFRADVNFGTAARPFIVPNLLQAVILTRAPPTGLRAAGPWFVMASALTLIAAIVLANRLSRRIIGPLEAAEAVTGQIASGDLSAHVPDPPRADRELVSLARSINRMAESLARSRGLERQFLLSVSHELRTPLTSIRGFAEAIADGAAPDTSRAAEVIASEGRRLERLVGDLLDLAKLDARRFTLDLRRVDLSEVVGDTSEGFRPAAEGLGLRLAVEAGPLGAVHVTADPDRLAQVVANLVENALRYAASGVRVAAASVGGHPLFWVEDDGAGIASEDLPRVFDRLFMSSRYPARQLGSGLGLAIVSELVQAMGGAVRAESPILGPRGTRVVVTLSAWSEIRASSLSTV